MRFVSLLTLVLVCALAVVTGQQWDALERTSRGPEAISRLRSDGPSGHLRSILEALDIPVSSHFRG